MQLSYRELQDIIKASSKHSQGQGQNGERQDKAFIGQYVLVRCRDAGVHAGYLRSYNGRSCILTQSRRLDRFKCLEGDSCTAAAFYGIDLKWDGLRIHRPLETIMLTENCEIIPMTDDAIKSVQEAPEYRPNG